MQNIHTDPNKFILRHLILLFVFLFLYNTVDTEASEWKAGAASIVITPEESLMMAGYGFGTPSEGKIHDLYAKALAIEGPDGNKVVIVTADLLGLTKELTNTISQEIYNSFGIPRKSLLFNTSHTHSGPGISNPFKSIPEEFSTKLDAYVQLLKKKYISVISQAINNLEPASLTFSSVKPTPFAVSRRYPSPEGIVYRSTPSSYYTGGPRDDIVPVLRVTNSDGDIKAILFGYACHPITLNINQFCGDYPGFAQRYIEEAYPGSIALFVQGCSGELVPNARFQLEYAMGHGKALADAVKKALDGKQILITKSIECAYDEVTLELQTAPERKVLEKNLKSNNVNLQKKATYLLNQLDKNGKIETSYQCPLQAVCFGNELLIIGISGETVAGYSVKLKSEFKNHQFVWVAGYCNDVFAYLPTWKILKEGGYEGERAMTYFTLPSPFTDTVEKHVLDGVRTLVEKISK